MAFVNENFLQLESNYLFVEVAHRVSAYQEAHPEKKIIRLGIGDVTRPLVPAVIEALHKAVEEMGQAATFRGYGPEQGYAFLREAICRHDFTQRGMDIQPDEIFVSDGAKSDTGNIGDLFSVENRVALTNPVYPVYADTNIMSGRKASLVYLPCTPGNQFTPEPPMEAVDIVYLCYPNNPVGNVLSREQLAGWVEWARRTGALILFDAAYEAFVTEEGVPRSIFEIEGARECAIEFRSFSKTAGFTGLRCGYTIIPKEVTARTREGKRVALHPLWNRRHSTKFNGTAYIVQRAAEAVFSPAGQQQVMENINFYLDNARLIRNTFMEMGAQVQGGINSPYIWVSTPHEMRSWDYFDHLLSDLQIVGTPGVGFGSCGEGCFRFTAFGSREQTQQAMERIKKGL